MSPNLASLVRDLQRRKGRERRKLAVAEGVRLVEEALAAGVRFRGAVVDPTLRDTPRGAALLARLADHAVAIEELAPRELRALADADTPQGVLAVIEPTRWQAADVVPKPGRPALLLDGVQDPGNVGALLRTAFALGAAGVLALKGTADLSNPKVIRGGMGATFRLPAALVSDDDLVQWVARHDVTVWAAAAGGTPLKRAPVPERLALAVGNEGAGVRPFLKSLARLKVAIPLARGAESLNVAVAAGIILYDVAHRD